MLGQVIQSCVSTIRQPASILLPLPLQGEICDYNHVTYPTLYCITYFAQACVETYAVHVYVQHEHTPEYITMIKGSKANCNMVIHLLLQFKNDTLI